MAQPIVHQVTQVMIAEFLIENVDTSVSTAKSLKQQVDALVSKFTAWEKANTTNRDLVSMITAVDGEGYSTSCYTEIRALVTQWLVKAMSRRKDLLSKCTISSPETFHVTYWPINKDMDVSCSYSDQSCLENISDELTGEKSLEVAVKGHPLALELLQHTIDGSES